MATTKKSTSKSSTAKKPSTKSRATNSKPKVTRKTATNSAKATASKVATKSKPEIISPAKPVSKVKNAFSNLKKWNLVLASLHAVQAGVMLYLAKDFTLPLTGSFLTFNEATSSLDSASRLIADVPLAWLLVAFLTMSSVAHLIIATVWWKGYRKDLDSGMNRARWWEYALSASTMMVAISMLAGTYDMATLLLIFGTTAVMNLLGLVMEVHNRGNDKPNWQSFNVGILSGALPWVAVGLGFVFNWLYGNGTPPTFVYFVYVSIFVFFNTFAINMYLQYKRKGKWANYMYGEKVYMILSLVAKSALAWQVFAGTLRP